MDIKFDESDIRVALAGEINLVVRILSGSFDVIVNMPPYAVVVCKSKTITLLGAISSISCLIVFTSP